MSQDEAITVFRDNRLYLFCCAKCRDKWTCIIDPDNHLRFF
ncbi:MAG: TRASH domain-containing protein [Deltaproteobacteria bacterium]|nr:MAG: TRASH domain-containing protein [Deltaproteobacteria bacterium]